VSASSSEFPRDRHPLQSTTSPWHAASEPGEHMEDDRVPHDLPLPEGPEPSESDVLRVAGWITSHNLHGILLRCVSRLYAETRPSRAYQRRCK
jgi:hypothetical protein